jgi:signal transduction histidine kinase
MNQEQELVETIVASVADGVLVVDHSGRIRFANPAAGALFSREIEDLVGTEFGFPIVIGKTTEIELVRRGRSLGTAELRVADMSWGDEHVSLVSLRDITERKQAEETARQLALEQAARVQAEELSQAKTDFLAVMSHELRTPLNAVLGYTELLDLGVTGPLTDAQRGHLHRVMMSARHLLRLVNEILDFSTLEAGQLAVERRPHRAAVVADMACDIVQALAERRKLDLSRRYEARKDRRYVGDEKRTQQILVNLLSNSLKFTNPPGTVSMEIVEVERPPSTLAASPSGRWVGFRVSDTGIGIPEDQHEAVFTPFTQLDTGHTRWRDGTGLGLPLSRRLARLMGGDVTVESSPGEGSTFTLWLPAAAE